MPRAARQISSTGYYHVIMRGQNKQFIFNRNIDKTYFMKSLNKIEKDEQVSVVAWCLMDNHVHLVVKAEPEMLAIVFKRLNIKYAMYYHREHKTLGHVFQDRFMSEAIESDAYLMNVVRYVHMNPVKGKLTKKIDQYEWSSYNHFLTETLSSEQQFVMKLLNNEDNYKVFHQQVDDQEYLEIKEDQLRFRLERARKIVSFYCGQQGISDVSEVVDDPSKLKELLTKLSEESGLSKRKIAAEYGLSVARVQSLTKKES